MAEFVSPRGVRVSVADDKQLGFGWVADDEAVIEAPEGAPAESWKVDELRAFAEREGIDLGDATKKADILAALTAE